MAVFFKAFIVGAVAMVVASSDVDVNVGEIVDTAKLLVSLM